jgi:hypothetical protein
MQAEALRFRTSWNAPIRLEGVGDCTLSPAKLNAPRHRPVSSCAPWLFTPRFHRADVELTVEEEGKVDLSAHFGGVGLIGGGVWPLAAIARKNRPALAGRASMYAAASPRVRRTPAVLGRERLGELLEEVRGRQRHAAYFRWPERRVESVLSQSLRRDSAESTGAIWRGGLPA